MPGDTRIAVVHYGGRSSGAQTIQISMLDAATGTTQWTWESEANAWDGGYDLRGLPNGDVLFLARLELSGLPGAPSAKLFMLDGQTGRERWRWQNSPPSNAQLSVTRFITITPQRIILEETEDQSGVRSETCRSVDAITGQSVWQRPLTSPTVFNSVNAAVFLSNGDLLISLANSMRNGLPVAFLARWSAQTGEPIWEVPTDTASQLNLIDEDSFYTVAPESYQLPGRAVCSRRSTRDGQVVWTRKFLCGTGPNGFPQKIRTTADGDIRINVLEIESTFAWSWRAWRRNPLHPDQARERAMICLMDRRKFRGSDGEPIEETPFGSHKRSFTTKESPVPQFLPTQDSITCIIRNPRSIDLYRWADDGGGEPDPKTLIPPRREKTAGAQPSSDSRRAALFGSTNDNQQWWVAAWLDL